MGMITEEAARLQIMKRLEATGRNKTVCLWGWEVETLLKMIDELKNKARREKDA